MRYILGTLCFAILIAFFYSHSSRNSFTVVDIPKDNFNQLKTNADTIEGKFLFGYQGWFSTPNSEYFKNWKHWSSDKDINSPPTPSNSSFDFYPDTSEYLNKYEIPLSDNSLLTSSSGNNIHLYSASDLSTIDLHFKWMKEYSLDGVFHMRFVSAISDRNSEIYLFKDKVLNNIRISAEKYDRVFALRYNITDPSNPKSIYGNVQNEYDAVIGDWKRLVDMGLVDSSAYLHQSGLPVVSIYGIGFRKDMTTASLEAQKKILRFFKNAKDKKYRAFVVAGVPSMWRSAADKNQFDSRKSDAAINSKLEAYSSLYSQHYIDAIHPWHVGRYKQYRFKNYYEQVILKDIEIAKDNGIMYIPTVWPGFSWAHLTDNCENRNQIPRSGGQFYWEQLSFLLENKDIQTIFSANFDEVDEGTAIFKQIATEIDLPRGSSLSCSKNNIAYIPFNEDGFEIQNDFYLNLASIATSILKLDYLRSDIAHSVPNLPVVETVSFSKDNQTSKLTIFSGEENFSLYLSGHRLFKQRPIYKINPGGYRITIFNSMINAVVYATVVSGDSDDLQLSVDLPELPDGKYKVVVKTYDTVSKPLVLEVNSSND
ncbi:hypothetical protein [Alteromonas sp. RKMC-009]|uniref:hypothetical protein n=1 Tax=Alteromonas sp. RKMC-009 TaxID=2267264 RepID=UPI000E692376|nr:hypothetical protein [Alteromonas sp. RKMC-009]AYA62823.3 hypothetical protein DS731_01715 [Alteromonas sp. RKMC-009]